jgi:hypothetical protein
MSQVQPLTFECNLTHEQEQGTPKGYVPLIITQSVTSNVAFLGSHLSPVPVLRLCFIRPMEFGLGKVPSSEIATGGFLKSHCTDFRSGPRSSICSYDLPNAMER